MGRKLIKSSDVNIPQTYEQTLRNTLTKIPTRNLKAKSGGVCPHCKKEYALLSQHITKAHTHYYLEVKYNDDDLESSTLTVKDQGGKVLEKDIQVDSTGWTTDDLDTIIFYYELKHQEATTVTIDSNKNVELHRESYSEKTGNTNGRTGFKNWSVKFV